ncbi:MAG TPA: type II toxin-antitoxin system RelE/ParE family toxin [Rhizomicrobium sp.]
MSRVLFRQEAENDVAEAFAWYESRSKGLGADFLRALDVAVSSIQRRPSLHREIAPGRRRVLLRRFPYSVVYYLHNEDLVIVACFHGKRDPRRLQDRL